MLPDFKGDEIPACKSNPPRKGNEKAKGKGASSGKFTPRTFAEISRQVRGRTPVVILKEQSETGEKNVCFRDRAIPARGICIYICIGSVLALRT